jgi:O-antigen/teichoic acid export membrane protein
MSTIRRQSIISSIIVYFGFALGLLNTYLFTREGGLSKEEYGLTGTFIAFANIMFAIGGLAMPSYIVKFFPYYKSHLPEKKNDQLAWALIISSLGFAVVLICGIAFKNILVDKIFNNSPELLRYYYWTFPFGFGYTIFMILEAYAWQYRRSSFTNFMREVFFRLLVTTLVLMVTFHIIKSFDSFIISYSFLYIIVVIVFLLNLYKNRQLYLHFSLSRVTKRFLKKILTLVAFVWSGSLILNIATVIDTIIIAAVLPNGMAALAPFLLAQNITSIIQAPQRAIVTASIGPLSEAWKEKDYQKIGMLYHRSSINQLVFACAMFCLIWLNFRDGIQTFHLQEAYLAAQWPFFFLGLTKIIDMGTGVNAQIIGTSTYWRFELVSGLVLMTLMLPLNWLLTQRLGILGPAISNLIAFTIYNAVRYIFLWRKIHMQPFTWKTVLTLLLAGACYLISFVVLRNFSGIGGILLRSSLFIVLFATGTFLMKLSPDALPVLLTLKKKLRLGN